MSKSCPKCGAVISDTAKFCGKCGCNVKENEQKTVDAFCTECGAKRSLGDTFCPECGARYENGEDNTVKADGFGFLDVDGWGETLSKFNAVEEANRFVDFTYRKMPNGKIIIEKLLDEYAFEVVIPNGVTAIGDGAFENSGVLSVTLPNGITAIGKRAFANCKSLEIINFPESLIKIDDEAFLGCENLEIEIPNTVKIVGNNTINGTKTDILKREEEVSKKWQVGATVIFGSYYQSNSSIKESIEWEVLAREGNKALLISKYALDCKKYNEEYIGVTWENCTIRNWLNGEFFNIVFDSKEQKRILPAILRNADNPLCLIKGGVSTTDKIFLLSIGEVEEYFSSDSARKCKPTIYAKECIWNCPTEFCCWWLRSPGGLQEVAAVVNYIGEVDCIGCHVDNRKTAIRPAMWVSIK